MGRLSNQKEEYNKYSIEKNNFSIIFFEIDSI